MADKLTISARGWTSTTGCGRSARPHRRRRSMTDANPAFDTVHRAAHPCPHVPRRVHAQRRAERRGDGYRCRSIGTGHLADRRCVVAQGLTEIRDEIVAAATSRPPKVPTPHDLNAAIENCWPINCAGATHGLSGLTSPTARAATSWRRRDRVRYRSAARWDWREQLSRAPAEHAPRQLLLQRRISHGHTLPRPAGPHNFTVCRDHPRIVVR